jgi:hypothetical protein
VDLCVALQVMLSDKALAASIALVLTIAKMSLNVGSDVLTTSEDFAATFIKAGPLASCGILLADVARDFFWCNTSVLIACVNLKIIEDLGLRE